MAETGKRDDPYQQFNFLVEIDGIVRAGFTECSGLTTDTDVTEYREGADAELSVKKLAGLRKYTNITLKRGYTQDKSLWEWRKKIINGQMERKRFSEWLMNQTHEAWISKWEGPTLNAKTNDVAIESIELVHERLDMV